MIIFLQLFMNSEEIQFSKLQFTVNSLLGPQGGLLISSTLEVVVLEIGTYIRGGLNKFLKSFQ